MNPLLQALFALVIGGTALFLGLPMLLDAQMQPAQNDAGNQIAQMQAAGGSYIRNHFSTLTTSIAIGANIPVTPAQLVTDGDLPASFNDQNVFGQKHILVITQQSTGALEGMVYTYGGDTIIDPVAVRVSQAGPPNATVLLADDTSNFEGAAGGETVPVAYFQNAGYPATAGHIGAHIQSATYAAESPFLNRYATGNLDDNTMHTAQYMDGNNLEMAAPGATTGGGNIDMAGGNLNAATTVTATQQVTTPMVADPTAPSYQISMAGTSNIKNLVATGNITATTVYGTDYLHTSDARLKTNIRQIQGALDLIKSMQGDRFQWIENGSPSIGFMAQDVQRVFPEAVKQRPDGKLAVEYDIIAAPLVEAVKELAGEVETLKAANAASKLQSAGQAWP
jgi:hypothetical protein